MTETCAAPDGTARVEAIVAVRRRGVPGQVLDPPPAGFELPAEHLDPVAVDAWVSASLTSTLTTTLTTAPTTALRATAAASRHA